MIKRLFDFTASLVALLVLSPILLVLLVLIAVKLGRPVVFVQKRPGFKGQPFNMLKFRTMSNETDSDGNLLPDELRLTRFGKFVRASSLDELPGLVCVLKGDMSLVGPRPLLMEYLPLYSDTQQRRHDAKPGITGWAQVNGRNAISWDDKFKLDVWYVENQSFLLDLKILFRTVYKVFKREGISQADHVTMERFTGNR